MENADVASDIETTGEVTPSDCPFMTIDEIEEHTPGVTAKDMLGHLVLELSDTYAYTHQPGLREAVEPAEPSKPTLMESVIAMLDENVRSAKDALPQVIDNEPLAEVHSHRQKIKILEALATILKARLEFEKIEAAPY
jgi:hypothetical protein